MPATCSVHWLRLIALLSTALFQASVHAQSRIWIRQFGGFQDQLASAVLRAEDGGVWVAGEDWGNFLGQNLGQGSDAFLARLNDLGNMTWGIKFGTNTSDSAMHLAPGKNGSVFVAGETIGALGAPQAGGRDVWLAKYSDGGACLWVRQIGSPAIEYDSGVCSDGAGGVFLTGTTMGSLAAPNAGEQDAWLAQYDAEGSRLWMTQFGSPGLDGTSGLAVPLPGRIIIGGVTTGNLFGTLGGLADAWLACFDSQGQLLWGRQFGTPQWEVGRRLCPDGSGGVFVVGDTGGVMAGTTPGGIWVARYDAKGNRTGLVQFPFNAGSSATPYAVCADGMGGLYMGGITGGPFGGPSAGGNDAFIAHVRDGTQIAWVRQFGTPFYDGVAGLAPAGPGRVYACGSTAGNIITGGGTGDNWDAWVALYESCYADCNADGALSLADFACFQAKYLAADPYADCNNDGAVNLADFGCFQTRYVLGCP
jgi:hypothetical protein